MEIEDSVVRKVPVILSKGLAGRLFLFEYQRESRSLQDVYAGQKVIKSCIKPKQQKVEIQLEMSKDSHNFNPGRAKKLANKGTPKSSEPGSSSAMIETQVLASAAAIGKNQEKFAVGVIHEQTPGQYEIHLNALNGIVHMKQSYNYMDLTEKKTDLEKKQEAVAQNKTAPTKPINVRFARQDPKRMKLAQTKSLAAQQRIKEEEPWCETEYFKMDSSESRLEKEKLLSDQQESNASNILVDTPEVFLPVLCSQEAKQITTDIQHSGPKSAEYISKLQFNEQVIERMKQAHVISFSRLKKYLDNRKSDTDILSALQRAAVPVRGNWVVGSEHLYANDFVSSTGVKAEQLCRARNHILYMFSQKEVIEQKEAGIATKLPPSDVVEILKKISCQTKRKFNGDVSEAGWRFKLPEDEVFIRNYPDEVTRLFKRFEVKVQNTTLKAEEERQAGDMKGGSSPKKSKGPSRQRKNSTKSRKDSYSSDH